MLGHELARSRKDRSRPHNPNYVHHGPTNNYIDTVPSSHNLYYQSTSYRLVVELICGLFCATLKFN